MTLKPMYPGVAYSPSTELSNSITAAAQVIPVDNINVFPAAPNVAVLERDEQRETIAYAGINGNSLTQVTRAIAEGDTAIDWSAGTQIARFFTANDLNDLQENVELLFAQHAAGTRFRPRGEWIPSMAMLADDIVTHNGETFRAIINSAGTTSPRESIRVGLGRWELWAERGADAIVDATLARVATTMPRTVVTATAAAPFDLNSARARTEGIYNLNFNVQTINALLNAPADFQLNASTSRGAHLVTIRGRNSAAGTQELTNLGDSVSQVSVEPMRWFRSFRDTTFSPWRRVPIGNTFHGEWYSGMTVSAGDMITLDGQIFRARIDSWGTGRPDVDNALARERWELLVARSAPTVDEERGTWSAASTRLGTVTQCHFLRVGNLVTLSGRINTSLLAGSGNVVITGLPFNTTMQGMGTHTVGHIRVFAGPSGTVGFSGVVSVNIAFGGLNNALAIVGLGAAAHSNLQFGFIVTYIR